MSRMRTPRLRSGEAHANPSMLALWQQRQSHARVCGISSPPRMPRQPWRAWSQQLLPPNTLSVRLLCTQSCSASVWGSAEDTS